MFKFRRYDLPRATSGHFYQSTALEFNRRFWRNLTSFYYQEEKLTEGSVSERKLQGELEVLVKMMAEC